MIAEIEPALFLNDEANSFIGRVACGVLPVAMASDPDDDFDDDFDEDFDDDFEDDFEIDLETEDDDGLDDEFDDEFDDDILPVKGKDAILDD